MGMFERGRDRVGWIRQPENVFYACHTACAVHKKKHFQAASTYELFECGRNGKAA